MASIAHLRPRSSCAGTERLLADVAKAVTAGVELGDRRAVIRALTADLHRNHARLQSAIVESRVWGAGHDPETACRIALGEGICADLISRLGLLLRKADQLDALLTVRDVGPAGLPATQ